MATRKYRKRRKKSSSADAAMTVTLQPGEVPSDEQLEAEAAAIEDESQSRYEVAKKDDLSLSALQRMTTEELAKVAKKEKIEDYPSLAKQKLVFEILKARARKQGLMMGEGTLAILPDGFG
ncbi:MAG: Rho termination factor N-terminal domain-containing protein, partial [Planctomycetota bacterium]